MNLSDALSGQRIIDDGTLWALFEIVSRHRLGLADASPHHELSAPSIE